MGKFDKLIYTMPVEHHNWDHYVSPRCGYGGRSVDPEATVNFGFSVTYDENVMEEPHMHDAKDEYLCKRKTSKEIGSANGRPHKEMSQVFEVAPHSDGAC